MPAAPVASKERLPEVFRAGVPVALGASRLVAGPSATRLLELLCRSRRADSRHGGGPQSAAKASAS